MYRNLIKNDILKSKLIAILIAAFITAAVALNSVAAMLGINLFGAIDHLMEEAKAAFEAKEADFIRAVIPIELSDKTATAQTASRYQAEFPFATVAVADEYVRQTFGGMIAACVIIATVLGVSDIRRLTISEHIKEA